jgi:5-methylcytosine-specific restriction enzyme subunit McrC
MARPIPVKNIYYLLLYAWNRLPEGSSVDVTGVPSPALPNLLAKVLLDVTNHLLRRGLDRGYRDNDEDLIRPRGRIRLGDTISRGLLSRVQVSCVVDDLSHNILQNQILKSTIERLVKTEDVDRKLRDGLAAVAVHFIEVQPIRITARDFGRVKIHSNNALYGLVMHVCEFVHGALVPEPGQKRFRFRDVLADPQVMGRIFQAFVRNFYKLEQSRFVVKADAFDWPVLEGVGKGQGLLPIMTTDVSLRDERRTILIECKWTPETFQHNRGKKRCAPIIYTNLMRMFRIILGRNRILLLSKGSCFTRK